MNIIQLSIRCIFRKRAKTFLLACVVFVTTLFLYAGWACKSANVQTQTEGKQALGASFRMEGNEANRHVRIDAALKKLGGQPGSVDGVHVTQYPSGAWGISHDNSFECLQIEDIETLANQKGISAYNITTANTIVNPVNFSRIEDPDTDQFSDERGVSLRGNLEMKFDHDVQNGNIQIGEGRFVVSADKNVCVVSRELAELNGLRIGDKLEFNNWKKRETSKIYSAEIIGIYDTNHKITPVMYGDSYRSENIIFTDLRFPEKPQGFDGEPLYQYATFWVENVNEYDAVKNQIKKANINWERYDFIDNTGMSDTMAENFGDMDKMSSIILVLVAVSGAGIIFLVLLFWLKSRVHEIGIFLSLGKSKVAIISQMLLEGILISCVSFLLATFFAPMISKTVANYLVDQQVQEQEEAKKANDGKVSVSSVTEYETIVTGVRTTVTGKVIFLSAVSIVGIVFVSVLSSCMFVVTQKPKEILSKMS